MCSRIVCFCFFLEINYESLMMDPTILLLPVSKTPVSGIGKLLLLLPTTTSARFLPSFPPSYYFLQLAFLLCVVCVCVYVCVLYAYSFSFSGLLFLRPLLLPPPPPLFPPSVGHTALAKRLPSGSAEKTQKAIQDFLVIREFKYTMLRYKDHGLPLKEQRNPFNVHDLFSMGM